MITRSPTCRAKIVYILFALCEISLVIGESANAQNSALDRARPMKNESSLVAWYKFDSEDSLGQDASGHGHNAKVVSAKRVQSKIGSAVLLDGTGGLEVASTELLHAKDGFTLDFWVKFTAVSKNINLVSKEGEYLLRIDPPNETSNLSFFVNVGGSLEPRVRSIVPEVCRWRHVVATWDGHDAALCIDGRYFKQERRGVCKPTSGPVLIGKPSKWGPTGFTGTMDEVKIYDRALTEGEILLSEFGVLTETPAETRSQETRFEFFKELKGWVGKNTDDVAVSNGVLSATVHGARSLLVNHTLDIPIGNSAFVSLRMAVKEGKNGKLLFVAAGGTEVVHFPVKGDGRPHSYILRLDTYPEWEGNLMTLALSPKTFSERV